VDDKLNGTGTLPGQVLVPLTEDEVQLLEAMERELRRETRIIYADVLIAVTRRYRAVADETAVG
jgi:hypothetical protein